MTRLLTNSIPFETDTDTTETRSRRERLATAAVAAPRLVPALAVVAGAVAAAAAGGSVDAGDWLPYAVAAALLLATVAASGAALRVPAGVTAAAAALLALAGWDALSLRWSPAPALARDEALLVALYVVALLLPALTLASRRDRSTAAALVPLACGGLAVATAVRMAAAADPAGLYSFGRLFSPITYWNAQAAFFLLGLWPGLALAARRGLPALVRAALVAAAAAAVCGWLLVQSKGGGIGLVASAVVVFAVTRRRVRLLVPTLLVGALAAPAFHRLTAPYPARLHGRAALDSAIHGAGRALLVVVAVAFVVGLVYALADGRTAPPRRAVLAAGALALAVLAAGLAVGAAAFVRHADGHPVAWAQEQWRNMDVGAGERAGSHFASVSPGRRDFWRVAWHDFEAHPVAGIGARGFASSYLEHGRTYQTPIRAHSLWMDVLSETGLVGLALVVAALGIPFVLLVRRALRGSTLAAAIAAAEAYWLVHASVDWIWTFPSDGALLFLLLGVGLAGGGARLGARAAVPLAAAATLLAIFAFAPPWLAARYDDGVLAGTSGDPQRDLRLAKRLDPLSTDPWVTQALVAASPRERIPPLVHAVRMEPRAVDVRFLLGRAYLAAGDRRAAARELIAAERLDPRDPLIFRALQNARRRP